MGVFWLADTKLHPGRSEGMSMHIPSDFPGLYVFKPRKARRCRITPRTKKSVRVATALNMQAAI